MSNKEEIEMIIGNCIHLTWTDIINFAFELGTFNRKDKTITIPRYKVSQWLHQMDKDFYSLSKPEQASDIRNAQRIIEELDKHGYMIVKKPQMKSPVYITQEDLNKFKENKNKEPK